jgi:hypothetical protein
VIGSTENPPAIMLRCNACGERTSVPVDGTNGAIGTDEGCVSDINIEIEVIQAMSQALARLPDQESQRRVLRWINDRFQPSSGSHDGPSTPNGVVDSNLGVDGLADLFDPPGMKPIMHCEDVEPTEQRGLETLVRGFVADFQRCALEWQGA